MPQPNNQSRFAKKSLGQNFLNSTTIRDQILEQAGDISGKNILEIGPGLGFLTEALLAAGAHVTAVELDDRVIEVLGEKFRNGIKSVPLNKGESKGGSFINKPSVSPFSRETKNTTEPQFTLIHDSILSQDLDKLFEQKKYSCIANIPYNITGPILRKLFAETENQPEFALLMVQKEVAQKICPKLHPKKGLKRSILSISVEIFAEAEICFLVGREHFDPSPRVDSAIIKLTKRAKSLVPKELERDFFTVVNAGFHEKRKKLPNSLSKYFGFNGKKLLGDIDPNLRAENLSIKDWLVITENFRKLEP